MADMIKDEVLGELEFDRYVWWRSIGKSLLGQDVMVELLVQDENQEGILDVQRKAYQTYLENEEKYIREVPKYILDYYKWNYEEIDRVVELEPGDQKDIITEKTLFEMCKCISFRLPETVVSDGYYHAHGVRIRLSFFSPNRNHVS